MARPIFLFFAIWCIAGVSLSSTSAISPKIVNGDDAQLGQFPWQAAIVGFNLTSLTYRLCSGAVISQDWIVTAAHCLTDMKYVGTRVATVENFNGPGVQQYSPEQIVHEDFNPVTLVNDIALVRVNETLIFNETLTSIALSDVDPHPGSVATVAGWGHSTHDNDANNTYALQYAEVKLISLEDCQHVYGDYVTEDMLCTRGDQGQGPCFNDGGAPLVTDYDSDPVLVGVFSFVSADGCNKDNPAGYTSIAAYRDWIKEKIDV